MLCSSEYKISSVVRNKESVDSKFCFWASKSAFENNYCPLHLHYGTVNCCRDICKPIVVIQVDVVLGYLVFAQICYGC